jgi:O-antigen/teichoic acid export membrane protein
MEPVALFNRAMAQRSLVTTHIVQIINATMLPKFAAEYRSETLTAENYLQRNRFVTGLLISIYAISAALAEPLVLLLFGSQWREAVPIAQVLCLIPLVALPYSLMKTAASASGRVSELARLELWCMGARLAAILAGAQYSLLAIAILMLVEVLVYAAALNRIGVKLMKLNGRVLYKSCYGDYAVGFISGSAAWAAATTSRFIPISGSASELTALICGSIVGLTVWLMAIRRLNGPLFIELIQWQRLAFKNLPFAIQRTKAE